MYPEAKARTMIREAWLPNIYLNPHGYPSHEWVQYFAGYSAWARGRRVRARTWWVPRGWFIPGFSWVEDEDNPDYQTAQFAILHLHGGCHDLEMRRCMRSTAACTIATRSMASRKTTDSPNTSTTAWS